jgi:hypothetical protein
MRDFKWRAKRLACHFHCLWWSTSTLVEKNGFRVCSCWTLLTVCFEACKHYSEAQLFMLMFF